MMQHSCKFQELKVDKEGWDDAILSQRGKYLKMDVLPSLLTIYWSLYSSELRFWPHSCCTTKDRML